jgi:hypothetical protein
VHACTTSWLRRMFEITGDGIAALGDEDLRTLMGLLREAELRRRNPPATSVTYDEMNPLGLANAAVVANLSWERP